jgi:hypothetical protein
VAFRPTDRERCLTECDRGRGQRSVIFGPVVGRYGSAVSHPPCISRTEQEHRLSVLRGRLGDQGEALDAQRLAPAVASVPEQASASANCACAPLAKLSSRNPRARG